MLAALVLFALTAGAAFAGLGVARRFAPEGRAELGVLWTLATFAVIVTPVFALGYAGALAPAPLVAASVLASTVALVASAWGTTLAAHAHGTWRDLASLARVPRDAFRLALTERSVAAVALAVATAAIVASAVLTYLAPSDSWDGFFYHEPMVGFALQNHGFAVVDLPQNPVVQAANGYPRACEALALWFVIFTDKTLIEIGNTLAAPGWMLAVYALLRRYGGDRVTSMGWASVGLLAPAMLTQLRTSMIDVEVQLFLIAALHFATKKGRRIEDAAAAWLALCLVMASKSSALAWVPPIALVVLARAVTTAPGRARRVALAAAAAGGLAIAGAFALTFVRNAIAFGNPVWPVTFRLPRLGIDLRGVATLAQISPEPRLADIVRLKLHFPVAGMADIIERDYGYAVPWVVAPLAMIAFVVAAASAIRARLSRGRDAGAEAILVALVVGLVLLKVSPNLNVARFNMASVAAAVAGVVWLGARCGGRLPEGTLGAATVLAIVPWIWTGWLFGDLTLRDVAALARAPAAERAAMTVAHFEMPRETAHARERELGPGDVVAFTEETAFVGALWNHAMSNRVVFVRAGDAATLSARLDQVSARWAVVGERSKGRNALAARPADWELVGVAVRQDRTLAFRRRGMAGL